MNHDCPNCNVETNVLREEVCGARKPGLSQCPDCGSKYHFTTITGRGLSAVVEIRRAK